MKKTFLFLLFLSICFCFSIWFLSSKTASAEILSGICEGNTKWAYDTRTRELSLSGKGTVTKPISDKFNKERYKKLRYYRYQIETIRIGAGIRSIDVEFFWALPFLEAVYVDSENPNYTSKDGVLFSRSSIAGSKEMPPDNKRGCSVLIQYPRAKTGASYTIPSTVTHIGDLAFAGNTYLTEVVCPTKLQEIGSGAFYRCVKLKNINISELALLKKLTDYYTTSLSISTYPWWDSEYYVGRHSNDLDGYDYEEIWAEKNYIGTFEGTNLETFIMPEHLQFIANDTFRDCSNIQKLYIGKDFIGEPTVADTTPEDNTFSQTALPFYYMNFKELEIHPQNPKYVLKNNILYTKDMSTLCRVFDGLGAGDYFYDYIDPEDTTAYFPLHLKKDIILDKRVKKIANGAFYNCKTVRSVKTDAGLAEIGSAAFCNSSIEYFTVNGGIQKIDTAAFKNSGLKYLSCSAPIYTICNKAFYSCGTLRVVRCSAISEIADRAFQFCYALHTVSCVSIRKVGERSFAECYGLREIPLPGQAQDNSFSDCHRLIYNLGRKQIDFKKVTQPKEVVLAEELLAVTTALPLPTYSLPQRDESYVPPWSTERTHTEEVVRRDKKLYRDVKFFYYPANRYFLRLWSSLVA